jgi:hypothetical protein
MKKTSFDLFVERNRIPWYYRAIALVASWLVLGGFILLPLVFTSNADNIKTSRTALVSIGVAFFITGYIAISVTAVLSKSILFCFDAVLLPILTSSVIGLAAVVFNHSLHKTFPVSDIYIIIPLTLASLSTVTSACLAGYTYYRIKLITHSDNRRKIHTIREEASAWPGTLRDSTSMQSLLPAAQQQQRDSAQRGSVGSVSAMIPEDEQQRQQLLRLLLRREAARQPSPDSESTYRIDLPDPLNENDYLRVPTPGAAEESSLPGSGTRYQLSKLLGGANRARSQTMDSVDPRQRRREEIERGHVSLSPPNANPNAGEYWPGSPQAPQQYTPRTEGMPSPWSGGGVTRYA